MRAGAVLLGGTLSLPTKGEPRATAILLPGSGHHDRDETIGSHKPFAVIAEHLAAARIGSLRLDGRGVGQSGGSTNDVDFTSKVADALVARRWLIDERRVAEDRLLFIGHSEGGLVGAAAAADKPTPLAMLAGPAQPIAETLHFLAEMQSKAAGASDRQIAHEQAMNTAAFALAARPGTPPRRELIMLIASHLETWPDVGNSLNDADRNAAAETMADTLLAPDFRSLLQQSPADYLQRLSCPVLAMFGERDCQISADANLAVFRQATAANPYASSIVLPSHNHLFQAAVTGQIEEYATLGPAPSAVALNALIDWVKEVFC
jgi:pimeloyl-ACP methyl ester carboxylesterase